MFLLSLFVWGYHIYIYIFCAYTSTHHRVSKEHCSAEHLVRQIYGAISQQNITDITVIIQQIIQPFNPTNFLSGGDGHFCNPTLGHLEFAGSSTFYMFIQVYIYILKFEHSSLFIKTRVYADLLLAISRRVMSYLKRMIGKAGNIAGVVATGRRSP